MKHHLKRVKLVVFEESTVQGLITTLDNPSKKHISKIIHLLMVKEALTMIMDLSPEDQNARAPKKQLKIYFKNGYYDATDEGDITVRNSYNSWNYSKEIPMINGEYVTGYNRYKTKSRYLYSS